MIKKVIKFGASFCYPCKVYAKTFHDVANKEAFSDIEFEEVDIEEEEEEAEKYNVSSVPTTIGLDKKGEVVFRVGGNITKAELESYLIDNGDN